MRENLNGEFAARAAEALTAAGSVEGYLVFAIGRNTDGQLAWNLDHGQFDAFVSLLRRLTGPPRDRAAFYRCVRIWAAERQFMRLALSWFLAGASAREFAALCARLIEHLP